VSALVRHSFERRFNAPRVKVWEAIADTARYNEFIGLPKHDIREETQSDGSVRFFATAKVGPVALAWEDIPQEWVHQQWFRHLRVFSKGPLESLKAIVHFEETGEGGAVCRYTLEVAPRGLFGKLLLKLGFFKAAERDFNTAADQVEIWAASGGEATAFEGKPIEPDADLRARLDNAINRIDTSRYGHGLGRQLADWLLTAQEIDLMRIRPLTLARIWRVPERHVVELCLEAVKDGLLESRWDLLCPRCRGAKLAAHALDELPSGAHCPSCNIAYDRDFSRNVELTFQPAPSIRQVVHGEFCLFGPMTTPHIQAQITLEAGDVEEIEATLAPGPFRARTLETGPELHFDFSGGDFPTLVFTGDAIRLAASPSPPGRIHLENRNERRRTLIIESRDWASDSLTAHRATTMQAFRHLFSDAVLKGGDEVSIAQVTLLFTDLKGSTALYEDVGDAPAYGLVREHFEFLATLVREHEGSVVKTIGDAVMAAFADPADGLRCAIAIQTQLGAFNRDHESMPIAIKAGVHVGSTIAVTMNDRLDYFGGTVNMAARLQNESEAGEIVLSRAMIDDPAVETLLKGRHLTEDTQLLRGFETPVTFWRLRPPFPEAAGEG
jgi:class 3 adenylate cyclase